MRTIAAQMPATSQNTLTQARDAKALAPFAGGVLVPTMGALHEGHAELIRRARALDETRVVVSIFVNPTQFNDPADFQRYPRTLEHDLRACAAAGAACAYTPEVHEVYPPGAAQAQPALPEVARSVGLEDRFRPGHFEGVYRVVKRLFELVRPRIAIFGEKDWQQLQLVRALVKREGMTIDIIAAPTVRESDGLAMSSRNARLSPDERRRALGLSRGIEAARQHTDVASAERAAWRTMIEHGVTPEYAAVRDGATLGPVTSRDTARVLVAGKVGEVRLIDNAGWV